MVAETLHLPNLRKLFIPSDMPGHIICDIDLKGADAQVVAWEADDKELKEAFRRGDDVHSMNASLLNAPRPMAKRWVHATNYGAVPRTTAISCSIPVAHSEKLTRLWFHRHPGIKRWHKRTEMQLQGFQCWRCWSTRIAGRKCGECGAMVGRTVGNKFGYRIVYFDRIDGLLPEALAWVPQSTVALVSRKAMRIINKQFHPHVQIRLQVHDSLAFTLRKRNMSLLPELHEAISIPIPYDDPLVIPWSFSMSDRSWGDCEKMPWPQ